MGIFKIRNRSILTDSAAISRVGLYIASHPDALLDSSGKQIIKIDYLPLSSGIKEYVVSDAD